MLKKRQRFFKLEACKTRNKRRRACAELLSQLGRFSLPQEGIVSILRKRLATHLQALAVQVKNPRKVKIFDHGTTTVETLMGTGKEGTNHGTGETCTLRKSTEYAVFRILSLCRT